MIKTFFKTAYRNLSKNKLFTILNVIGLALGMSISLLFVALLSFLSRFDDFHPHKERIYRVTTQVYDNDENPRYASAPFALGQIMKDDFTGIEKITRIQGSLYGDANYGEKKIRLSGFFADPEFLEIFNFPLLRGNKNTVLSNPNSIVLSETEAKKIFGSKDPMGEILTLQPYGDLLVTGVVKDQPENSHMQFGAVVSYATITSSYGNILLEKQKDWKNFSNSYVYFRLLKDTDPDSIEKSLNLIANQKFQDQQIKVSFELQGLEEIVPGPELRDQIGPNWSYFGLSLVALLTLIILIPACSNYAHLSISQSLERMREIGVRKVMGGQKKHIFLQFIVESTTIVFLALFFAYLIFEAIRKDLLHSMVETSPIDLTPTSTTFIGFIIFALLVGIVSGIIPALYFSKIKALNALKGKELKTKGRFSFRKVILTSQFMLSLGFIMAVVIIMRQYNYSVNYDFGFEQEDVLDVELQNVDPKFFAYEFSKLNSLKEISMSSHLLGIAPSPEHYIKSFNFLDSIEVSSMSVNENYISNLKLELISGKNFTDDPAENSGYIIVNEEFMKSLHKKNPAGTMDHTFVLNDGRIVKIGGVLKNFHYTNLKDPIANFYFEYDPEKFNYANLKLESKDIAGDFAEMETIWKKIGGETKFTAQLFSNEIKDAYSFYKMIIKLWGFLGIMAITVACLGLLGTVSFNIKKRFKEISVRKVMGASTKRLVLLLSKDFIVIMLITSIITIPVIYFWFNELLVSIQHYSVQIGFVEITVSLGIILSLGLLTILSQTYKAANANPVDNLRSE